MNKTQKKKPVIGITMGDPAGVGPEVVVKTLVSMKLHSYCSPVIIGDYKAIEEVLSHLNIKTDVVSFSDLSNCSFDENKISVFDCGCMDQNGFEYGKVSKNCGDISFQAVVKAVELAKNGVLDAIVTAPICKESWHLAGHHFDGHTELLAHLTDTKDYRMLFSSDKMKVVLTTTHLPLQQACLKITTKQVYDTIVQGAGHLEMLGISSPRIAVCGLNPHAGESGIFGREEIDKIMPAIENAKDDGINTKGPFPADTIFLSALNGDFDLVVAMYHDQGLIPVKLLSFETAVNVTVGLPIIRTSVDHGTAFDIAGQGIAGHKNMHCAIEYAFNLIKKAL